MYITEKIIEMRVNFASSLINSMRMVVGPGPKFRKDDSVQQIQGGPLMLVDEVKFTSLKGPCRVNCTWYNKELGCTQSGTFSEEDLKYYDWQNPPPEHIIKRDKIDAN